MILDELNTDVRDGDRERLLRGIDEAHRYRRQGAQNRPQRRYELEQSCKNPQRYRGTYVEREEHQGGYHPDHDHRDQLGNEPLPESAGDRRQHFIRARARLLWDNPDKAAPVQSRVDRQIDRKKDDEDEPRSNG